jgi:CDP-diacylglycerol--serine O-phosphatidyltransferase
MNRIGVLPALVTLANGFCGVVASDKVQDGRFYEAALLILLAMVFDLLDGMVARKAGLTSRFGAQLDSLSDAISFGVAPAFLVKVSVENQWPGVYPAKVITVLTALYAVCALLRLARYNVEHADKTGEGEGKGVSIFAGIPTPGAAGVLASVVFLQYDPDRRFDYGWVHFCTPVLATLLGYLMVSRIPFIHFGSKFLKGRRDFGYLFRVVVIVVLLIMFPHEFTAAGFWLYLLSGPVAAVLRRGRAPANGAAVDDEEPAEMPDGL